MKKYSYTANVTFSIKKKIEAKNMFEANKQAQNFFTSLDFSKLGFADEVKTTIFYGPLFGLLDKPNTTEFDAILGVDKCTSTGTVEAENEHDADREVRKIIRSIFEELQIASDITGGWVRVKIKNGDSIHTSTLGIGN